MTSDDHQSLANVYALLGRLWLHEVDQPLLQSIIDAGLGDALSDGALRLDDAFVSDRGFLEELSSQYCALFIGPKNHLPPYQSVWQTGQLQSETAASVRAFLQALNAPNLIDQKEMADHLGHQLALMSLIHRKLAATPKDDLIEMGREFFGRHLTWTKPLLTNVGDRADSSIHARFYARVGQLTGELIASESRFWLADQSP